MTFPSICLRRRSRAGLFSKSTAAQAAVAFEVVMQAGRSITAAISAGTTVKPSLHRELPVDFAQAILPS